MNISRIIEQRAQKNLSSEKVLVNLDYYVIHALDIRACLACNNEKSEALVLGNMNVLSLWAVIDEQSLELAAWRVVVDRDRILPLTRHFAFRERSILDAVVKHGEQGQAAKTKKHKPRGRGRELAK